MSGHESHVDGNLTAIELAHERTVPLGSLLVDAALVSVAGILGILFRYLPHVDPMIVQSGKMESDKHH